MDFNIGLRIIVFRFQMFFNGQSVIVNNFIFTVFLLLKSKTTIWHNKGKLEIRIKIRLTLERRMGHNDPSLVFQNPTTQKPLYFIFWPLENVDKLFNTLVTFQKQFSFLSYLKNDFSTPQKAVWVILTHKLLIEKNKNN